MKPEIIDFSRYLISQAKESVRTVLHENQQGNLILWQIPPSKMLPAHRHPHGQDIWIVLQGEAQLMDDENSRRIIRAGQSVMIGFGQVHGVVNTGEEDCVLVSMVSPEAGFEAA